jgi:uncharacterized membrane protein YphA (DoxX/SURF4 family)
MNSGRGRRVPNRLFSLTYPGGRAGVGLLLLRVAVGLTALTQGGIYLSSLGDSAPWTWAAGLLALATGSLLLIGFLSPFVCLIIGLGGAATALLSPPVYAQNLLNGGPFGLFVSGIAAAAMLVGPGAYSLDARLFGRREVIIPQSPRPSKP